MIVRSGKWMVEMAQRRLSAEMGARCVRAIGSLVDRSDGPQEIELHGHLTGEGGLDGW